MSIVLRTAATTQFTRAESTVAHATAACMYSPHSALRVKRSSSLLTSSTEQTDRCGENDSIILIMAQKVPWEVDDTILFSGCGR